MSTPPSPTSPPGAQRGDAGAILLGLGALLLFISLFLHWYQPGRSAWTVFEVWDLVLAGLAFAAARAALGRLGIARDASERWMAVPSVSAFVIVVFSLLNHPPAAAGAGPMIGIWLALFASIVMLAGVATSMARISLVIEMTERSRGVGSAPGLGLSRLRRRGAAKRPVDGASVPGTGAAASESPLFPPAPDEPEPPRSTPPRGVSDPAEEPTQAHTHAGSTHDAQTPEDTPGDPGVAPAPDGP